MLVFNTCVKQGIEGNLIDKRRLQIQKQKPVKKRNRILRTISDVNYRDALERISVFEPSSFSMVFSKDAWLQHMEKTFELEFSSSLLSELQNKHTVSVAPA